MLELSVHPTALVVAVMSFYGPFYLGHAAITYLDGVTLEYLMELVIAGIFFIYGIKNYIL